MDKRRVLVDHGLLSEDQLAELRKAMSGEAGEKQALSADSGQDWTSMIPLLGGGRRNRPADHRPFLPRSSS